MATLDEIAKALAQLLASGAGPNPLPVDLANHMPAEASYLVKCAIHECRAMGAGLSSVRIAPELAADLQSIAEEPFLHEGVPISLDPGLGKRVEFWRIGTQGPSHEEHADNV